MKKKGTNELNLFSPVSGTMQGAFAISQEHGVVSRAPDHRDTSVKLNESNRPFLRSIVKAAFFVVRSVSHDETSFAYASPLPFWVDMVKWGQHREKGN